MLKRAIVIGASSGIGAAVSRKLASEGYKVALVARRIDKLDALRDSINGKGERQAFSFAHDVADIADVPGLFEQITRDLDGVDTVVYAAGIMPEVGPDEFDTVKDKAIIEVNVIGAMAWLNEAAKRFQVQQSGTIVGIGSVAGDRGRRGSPAYCASKACLHSYLEALRNRLSQHGVHVVTVKPGPVDTPMTEAIEKKPLLITAEQAADGVYGAIVRRPTVAYVPLQWMPIMAVIKSIPSVIFRKMDI
jgi:short-subunit dehydrogenase